jgi:hypothetical protein
VVGRLRHALGVLGYVFAGYGPLWFGAQNAVSAAGMIAAVSGVILALACLFGPHRPGSATCDAIQGDGYECAG